MNAEWIVGIATPITLVAIFTMYRLGDFEEFPGVRTIMRGAVRVFLVVAWLVPAAGTAAFGWVVTQEQERIYDWIQPLLDEIGNTGNHSSPIGDGQ